MGSKPVSSTQLLHPGACPALIPWYPLWWTVTWQCKAKQTPSGVVYVFSHSNGIDVVRQEKKKKGSKDAAEKEGRFCTWEKCGIHCEICEYTLKGPRRCFQEINAVKKERQKQGPERIFQIHSTKKKNLEGNTKKKKINSALSANWSGWPEPEEIS